MVEAKLRSISPDATPEEVAAIVAAIAALRGRDDGELDRDDTLHEWVRASRLRSHRSALQRGPWRLSGRLGSRVRA